MSHDLLQSLIDELGRLGARDIRHEYRSKHEFLYFLTADGRPMIYTLQSTISNRWTENYAVADLRRMCRGRVRQRCAGAPKRKRPHRTRKIVIPALPRITPGPDYFGCLAPLYREMVWRERLGPIYGSVAAASAHIADEAGRAAARIRMAAR